MTRNRPNPWWHHFIARWLLAGLLVLSLGDGLPPDEPGDDPIVGASA